MVAGLLPAEQLRKRVNIYLTAQERERIESGARSAGITVSNFIRLAALGQKVETVPTLNAQAYGQLGKLASNLNQLARSANEGRVVGIDPLLLYQIAEQVQLLRLDLAGGAP